MDSTYRRQVTTIALAISAYWLVSISIIFINKFLLSGTSLAAPCFVTAFQCLMTVGIIKVLMHVDAAFLSIPKMKVELHSLAKVFPLSLAFVGMITFNNLCLQKVGVSFYFIGRCLTTVFNMLLSYLILKEKTSRNAIICCLAIILGFLLGTDEESDVGDLTRSGIIYGLAASLFTSLNAIYTKKVLPLVDNNIWRLGLYNNINACCILIPLALVFGEWKSISEFDSKLDPIFWSMMIISGVFGFLIGVLTGLCIKVTSPLTHNVSATAKAAVQTLIAVLWYSEQKTLLWFFSNFIILAGSYGYSHVRKLEMKERIEQGRKVKPAIVKEVDLEKQLLTDKE